MSSSSPLHTLRRAEVFQALDTSPDGLTAEQVEERRALYGRNVLADAAQASTWQKWIQHLTHPMALLLWVAGAAALAIGRGELGAVIVVLVLVNAGFSYWREYRASQALSALKDLLPGYARVMRARQEARIPAADLVPGDILVLAEGDNIPADARLIEVYGLRTNNSTLTGESLPAAKIADPSLREDLSEIERPNLVFAGTSIAAGTGRAVVYATGMLTQFGRITNLTQGFKEEPSQLQVQMAHLSRYLVMVALAIGIIVFAVSITDNGIFPSEAFILAIGIFVAALPEGLPATVTLTLAMAVQRLAERGVLVKKLSAVETLGSISVICTDKSGTLTQNQMTVSRVWVAGTKLDVSGVGYEPKGVIKPSLYDPADLRDLCTAASLCNNSRLIAPSAGETRWTSLGDQTEVALRVLAIKAGLDEAQLSRDYPRVHELPFDARRKRMSTLHRSMGSTLAFVKGAPKEVLQLCISFQKNGKAIPLDDATRAEILAANDQYARSALRVLALARREISTRPNLYTPEGVEQGLTFLGLVGMMDPPRPEVAQAIHTLRQAGIRIAMITGDYGLTAESVARRLGMLATPSPRILTGAEVERMSEAELDELLDKEVIYSRMAPEHKLKLVSAYQQHGEVVAVIGDGVNDVPALRKADIGIVMGATGTDVAREAADVVLVGDNFESVVHAVEEGRAIFDNLRKFMTYIFASNVPEILPFILTALFHIPLALAVAQILAIDLGTDLLPALALGVEKPEPSVLSRPPNPRGKPLVDRGLLVRGFVWLGGIEAVLCYVAFFGVYFLAGYPIMNISLSSLPVTAAARTLYLMASTAFHVGVVACQVGNVFACRSETSNNRPLGWFSNKYLVAGVLVEVTLILCMVYITPLARIFYHVPLSPVYLLGLSLFTPLLYGLERSRKWIQRRSGYRKPLLSRGESL